LEKLGAIEEEQQGNSKEGIRIRRHGSRRGGYDSDGPDGTGEEKAEANKRLRRGRDQSNWSKRR